jgi:hypothetical protein
VMTPDRRGLALKAAMCSSKYSPRTTAMMRLRHFSA